MKRTYWKTVLREITGSLGRFLAIFAIVALGTGFFAGLIATAPDMRLSVDGYYDEAQMMDIRLLSTLGLTDDDVSTVAATEGVEAVMPAYSADVLTVQGEQEDVVTRIHSLPAEGGVWLNRVTVLDGRMPTAADECVAVRRKLAADTPAVGDVVTLSSANRDLSDTLTVSAFTVVGVVDSPWYFSIDKEYAAIGGGTVSAVLYAPQEAFCAAAYSALYVQVADAAALTAFSDEYDAAVDAVAGRLEAACDGLAQRRYDAITGEAQEQLAAARAEYEEQKADADRKLADAAAELAQARQEITDGEAALADAQRQIADRRQQLADAEEQYRAGQAAYETNRTELDTQKQAGLNELAAREAELEQNARELAAAEEQLTAAKPALDAAAVQIAEMERQLAALNAAGAGESEQAQALAAALTAAKETYEEQSAALSAQETALSDAAARLAEGRAQLAAARETAEGQFAAAEQQLASAKQELTEASAQIADGRTALAAAERQLSQKQAELASGKAELENGEADYAAAKQEAEEKLADGAAQLANAEADIAAVAFPTMYVQDRAAAIAAYSSFDGNCEKVSAIAVVFPVFFFLVAALVALTTMTRMVEEQRVQLGVLRALGYSKVAVAVKYLLYAGVATLAGAAGGLFAGMMVFPRAIYQAYSIMYITPPLTTPFRWDYALLIGAAALLCTGLTTWFACANALRERPARLMLPKAPKAGKRVFLERLPLWRHLSFSYKVMVRNLLRYKKRFFMTVIGVAGCTALLLTGFGLKDSIGGIVGKQYSELCHYDLLAMMKNEESLSKENVTPLLSDGRVAETLAVSQQSADVTHGGDAETVYLYVPRELDRVTDFLTLRERRSGQPQTITDSSALLTEKAAEQLGVSAGDTVTVSRVDGRQATVTVGGVVENYIYSYLYMSPTLYREAFGEEPAYQVLLLRENAGDGEQGLISDLLDTGEASAVSSVADLRANFSDLLNSMNAIVTILILCAGLLAFVVLYNLTNINITERRRELATLEVLGFYDGETAAYIFRENGVLTVIGLLAGLVGGIFLHRFVVHTAEVDMVMFGRVIQPLSYLWAALLTLVFAALVDVAMLPRLKRIDMVESMKSGE